VRLIEHPPDIALSPAPSERKAWAGKGNSHARKNLVERRGWAAPSPRHSFASCKVEIPRSQADCTLEGAVAKPNRPPLGPGRLSIRYPARAFSEIVALQGLEIIPRAGPYP
jgi:hypothetical protein